MNKIKLLYDVVKTMKEKDAFNGSLRVEGTKNDAKVISFSNDFQTDKETGITKAKINSEFDLNGNKMKNETNLEFNMKEHHHGAHGCHHGFHGMRNHMHHGEEDNIKGCSMKSKLSRAAFALNVLNSIKTEEKGDGTTLLTLNLKDLSEDMKDMCCDKMNHEHREGHEGFKHHAFIKEFLEMDDSVIEIFALISKNNELQKLQVIVDGKKTDASEAVVNKSLNAELNLTW